MPGANSSAERAAAWVVNMKNGPERSRLYNGHMTRRREIMQDAYRTTDHAEADAWLIGEWMSANAD